MELPHPIEDLRAREHEVLSELRDLALPHAEASAGLFVPLPINPDIYPAQSLTSFKVSGEPQSPETVEATALSVEPNFRKITETLGQLEESHGEITRIGEQLKAGQNIILVTNHGDLKDIAYVLAGYYSELKRLGYEDFHTSLVMSKIIGFLGIVTEDPDTTAAQLLTTLCDSQYFTFPRTKSIQNSKIATGIVNTYNEGARAVMKHQLHRGGNLFAMAASGTKDKPFPEDPNTYELGTIGHGTAQLMQVKNSLVMPVAIWIDNEGLDFQPCGVPRAVLNDDDAHAVMEDIRTSLESLKPSKKFVYNRPA